MAFLKYRRVGRGRGDNGGGDGNEYSGINSNNNNTNNTNNTNTNNTNSTNINEQHITIPLTNDNNSSKQVITMEI